MKVSLNELAANAVDKETPSANLAKGDKPGAQRTAPATAQRTPSGGGDPAQSNGSPAANNVTFRRDDAGQIYYVVTDARSGQELQEIPQAAVRKAGEGIAEYLKQEEAKAGSRLKTEA
ncbi:MAG TPA: hypothetical protein VGI16_10290 [Candidatus Acidoferrum sp.]|jgi:hypothetical protein